MPEKLDVAFLNEPSIILLCFKITMIQYHFDASSALTSYDMG